MKKTTVVPVHFSGRPCGDHIHLTGIKKIGEPLEMYESEDAGGSSVGYSPRYSEQWDRIFSRAKPDQPN